jgi:hypothetical protein
MRATKIFITLCLFFLGSKALDAGAISHAHQIPLSKVVLQDISYNQPILETILPINESSLLFCDEVDDDERNPLAKKYTELNKYAAASSAVQLLHHCYKAPKAVTAQISAGISPRYILLCTLRI